MATRVKESDKGEKAVLEKTPPSRRSPQRKRDVRTRRGGCPVAAPRRDQPKAGSAGTENDGQQSAIDHPKAFAPGLAIAFTCGIDLDAVRIVEGLDR